MVEEIIKAGWLRKRSNKMKIWQQRWFVLTATNIKYYSGPNEAQASGHMAIENVEVLREDGIAFAKKKSSQSQVFYIKHTSRTYHVSAENRLQAERWMMAINDQHQKALQKDSGSSNGATAASAVFSAQSNNWEGTAAKFRAAPATAGAGARGAGGGNSSPRGPIPPGNGSSSFQSDSLFDGPPPAAGAAGQPQQQALGNARKSDLLDLTFDSAPPAASPAKLAPAELKNDIMQMFDSTPQPGQHVPLGQPVVNQPPRSVVNPVAAQQQAAYAMGFNPSAGVGFNPSAGVAPQMGGGFGGVTNGAMGGGMPNAQPMMGGMAPMGASPGGFAQQPQMMGGGMGMMPQQQQQAAYGFNPFAPGVASSPAMGATPEASRPRAVSGSDGPTPLTPDNMKMGGKKLDRGTKQKNSIDIIDPFAGFGAK